MVPRKAMEEQLKNQERELADDISSLNKKVGRIFLRRFGWLMYTTVQISRKTIF